MRGSVRAAAVVRPQALAAQCLDFVALEGRAGIAVAALFDAVDPRNDTGLRHHVWQLLKRQQASGVLQFFYRSSSSDSTSTDAQHHASIQSNNSSSTSFIGKKRKRPIGSSQETGSDPRNGVPTTCSALASPAALSPSSSIQHSSSAANSPHDVAPMRDDSSERHQQQQQSPPTDARPSHSTATTAAAHRSSSSTDERKLSVEILASSDRDVPALALAAMTLDDALGTPTHHYRPTNSSRAATLMVVACAELRYRALNVPVRAIVAELAAEHLTILEAVGRARVQGVTVTELTALVHGGGSVKRLHNALDTLISYKLVVKRMMIVAKPAMRRLNIIHLPRFASAFSPKLFDASAEFESDEAYKKILCSAAEAYLRAVPGHSCVLTDLGRDLNLQKRHLEVLRGHVLHEAKRDEHYCLELFQAVLRPTKRNAMEPKILNCIRYKPSSAQTTAVLPRRGIAIELGLLEQIYRLIDTRGEHGATIVEMRNAIGLPGSKLPYKLVAILAGTYGLKAETIIQGKNKAFRLYTHAVETALAQRSSAPLLLANAPANASTDADNKRADVFSIRANLALKDALGGLEVDSTRLRRRTHLLQRLVREKIISLSSLRASVFSMEKQLATESEQSVASASVSAYSSSSAPTAVFASQLPSAVGMVDTRSISRIAEELEREGALRLLQLPLPAKNVSTKFRALKCVVFPGFEHDERFIQGFVKNYCRDERLRRIHQNTERNHVIRLQSADSDDDDDNEEDEADDANNGELDAGDTASEQDAKRPHATALESDALDVAQPSTTPVRTPRSSRKRRRQSTSATDANGTTDASNSTALVVLPISHDAQNEISYRIRRFVSPAQSGMHAQQYRKLGFAYGVMYRCKILHEFLWTYLHDASAEPSLQDDAAPVLRRSSDADAGGAGLSPGIVFSREAVLHAMPVHLYIQVFSGGAILSPTELLAVEDAVAHQRTFATLAPDVCAKVWSHESQRTAKVLGTLADLGLVTPHKIGMKSLIKILRTGYTDGRDGVLSRALKDNALGGLFRLEHTAQIVLDDKPQSSSSHEQLQFAAPSDDAVDSERNSVNDLSAIRLVGTTEKSYSFGNVLPLRFAFDRVDDVAQYWEALECLCLEQQMVMEVPKPTRNAPTVCAVPKPVKTRARRMLRILAWISKSRKPPAKASAPAASTAEGTLDTAAATTAAAKRTAERRSGIVSKSFVHRAKRRTSTDASKPSPRKRQSRAPDTRHDDDDNDDDDSRAHATPHRSAKRARTQSYDHHDHDDDDATGDQTDALDRTPGAKPTRAPPVWTEASERALLSLFLDNCRSRWHITIPQGLQRDGESVAFRNATLSRTGFGLVTIARTLGKRRIDVKKRLKEKLLEPSAKHAYELAKRDAIARAHPSGVFDEEVAIRASARLTALYRRAVMLVVAPLSEYHPLVAEELIANWSAPEIRLVWRYLWLKNWIVRATEKERVRGYTTSQRLQDFLKLTTLSYPLWLFRQAAEHESLLTSMALDDDAVLNSSSSSSRETLFEAEFPVNATPGQCAIELAGQVLGTCSLVATHASMRDESERALDPDARAALLGTRKRNLRFLNYKSLKGGSGFAAHLAKHVDFHKPSLLMDSWHVETKVHAPVSSTNDDDDDEDDCTRGLEAFSTAALAQDARPRKRHKVTTQVDSVGTSEALAAAVSALVGASGEAGVALAELLVALETQQQWTGVTRAAVAQSLDALVDRGALLCVNAYSEQRFLSKEHGDAWLLRPFALVSTSRNAPPRVVFEDEKDTLSFPWLKMDGTTHYRFLFSLQRKLLALVLTAPGITEQSVCSKLDKLLTLQDTREALALLVDEGLVYVRGTRVERQSLFQHTKRRHRDAVVALAGNALAVDRHAYTLHYFPHIACIQRFGSIVQDYQHEVGELHRAQLS